MRLVQSNLQVKLYYQGSNQFAGRLWEKTQDVIIENKLEKDENRIAILGHEVIHQTQKELQSESNRQWE